MRSFISTFFDFVLQTSDHSHRCGRDGFASPYSSWMISPYVFLGFALWRDRFYRARVMTSCSVPCDDETGVFLGSCDDETGFVERRVLLGVVLDLGATYFYFGAGLQLVDFRRGVQHHCGFAEYCCTLVSCC
ncbi:unnamed protein product [Microthlaspi erraticum]|uniref:Uncharacterized protein n=1 Tax=Microthlaspi erraticum TaxID=1685480 RepID=A0A6D2LHX8_9BRAS|nr:unnamed protein product [Microthlaspi erraticum]